MSAAMDMTRWQPARLPEGWHVKDVAAYLDSGWARTRTTYTMRLIHEEGWEFEFSTSDPSAIDEDALCSFLGALASARISGIGDARAYWENPRW